MIDPAHIKEEVMDPDSTTGNTPKKKPGRPKKLKQEKITEHVTVTKKRKIDRFKGMSEEEVLTRLLPDHLAPNLDIVIVGINPGLYAAFVGHHYAGPGNHFWKCLYLSGLIPEPMNAMQDFKLLDYGIGFTNIVARTTRGSADLSRKEIKQGAEILTEKLLKYKPKIAVFNGKGIYEVFVGHKNFYFGKQPEPLPGTETAVFVMPSSSARCSQLPRAVDKVPFYEALKKFRDHINGKLPDLKESEITFPDLELKTAKKEPKTEPGAYPGEFDPNMQMSMLGENGLNQFNAGNFKFFRHQDAKQNTSFPSHSSQTTLPQDELRLGAASKFTQDIVCVKQEPNPSSGEDHFLVQIKQEPGTEESPVSNCIQDGIVQIKREPGIEEGPHSNYKQGGMLQIKQEPGTTGSFTSEGNQSYNYLKYTESQPMPLSSSSSSSSSGQSDFLSGLYGLVNQVASQGPSGSAFGIVNSRSRPLQFNDALCGIVRDDSMIDLELVSPESRRSSVESSDSQPVSKNGRKTKLKNRKTKSATALLQSSSSPNSASPIPSDTPHSTPPSTQVNQIPTCQPVQPFTQFLPSHHNNAFPGLPITTYGNMPYFPHPPVTSYSHGYPMGPIYQQQSFTQMMNDDLGPYSAVNQNFNGFHPTPLPSDISQNTYHNGHSQPSSIYNPNLQIKQEKPDS